ncbi:MAG: NAD-dependent epimerase/dehydratase family protein [Lachnospiraceae bacterium]|nr:NAD-dependent epimerase/dehydratase family protein [Lachnospiraceae bacterium]
MRTMVIGGAGFIGSHLCDALLANGHKVVCIDDFSLGTKENIGHLSENEKFILYEADAADKVELKWIFEKTKPEAVYHLAANSDIQASAADPDIEYRNTYTTTYNVLYCMREYGVKSLFFASTSAVYGDKRDILLDENTPDLTPISYYGAAKLGSEALISAFSYMDDMRCLIFRFPNVIGPRLTHGVIFDLIRKLQKDGTQLEILGDGRQTKPYIYVDDLIGAIVRFMPMNDEKTASVLLYNLGVEGETSVTRIADILCEEMGLSDVQFHYTGGEGGWKGDVPRFKYCLNKIHNAGWKAEHTSDEAVRRTVKEVLKP